MVDVKGFGRAPSPVVDEWAARRRSELQGRASIRPEEPAPGLVALDPTPVSVYRFLGPGSRRKARVGAGRPAQQVGPEPPRSGGTGEGALPGP